MFASHHEGEDYARYPHPPHSASSYESATTSPMEMNTMYTIPSTVAFEPTMYTETSHYVLGNGNNSPTMYPEDSELRIPSSSLSAASAASSAAASPQSNPGQHSVPSPEWATSGLVQPTIVSNDFIAHHPDFGFHPQHVEEMNFDFAPPAKGYVDPSLINQEMGGLPMPAPHYDYHYQHHQQPQQQFPTSPSVASSPQLKMIRTNSSSPAYFPNPQMHPGTYAPSPYIDTTGRRPSMSSFISPASGEYHSGDETKIKQRCTYPDCGKVFKDLKAHMLTHQNERPEKCPIQTCEYHTKGFARKYDKNRHTLTHYKGTMVCGFCPGSGSATEKSFNRADVFKRHLTAVHGVEQTPPNSRKKGSMTIPSKKLTGYASDATGKCSTCSQTFANPQDFYEHLDDCVLRIVQQEDPSEAINVQCLTEVENDKDVQETLEKNNLPLTTQVTSDSGDGNDSDMADDDDDDSSSIKLSSGVSKKKGNPANGVQKSRGMTHSRGGVPMTMKAKNRKNRGERYPPSWGYDPANMTLKHRVMTCFDGARRLAKDDMALSTTHEVRLKLSDPKAYTTDLDVQTLKRAEGFHGATEEEKGIWISDDPTEAQFRQMSEAAMLASN